MMFRYLILLQIHLNKKKLVKNLKSKKERKYSKFKNLYSAIHIFLKLLSSHWIILIFPILWLGFICLIFMIPIALNNFQCSKSAAESMRLVHIAALGFFFLFILFQIIFDCFFNIVNIFKCEWRDIFIKYDPYNYRLDMISSTLVIPLTIVWALFGLISFSQLLLGVVLEIILFQGFFASGILTILITIFKKHYPFFKCFEKSKQKNKSTIGEIIEGPHLNLFIEYCEFEWSVENILFKLDAVEYKTLKSIQERDKLCREMKERYLLLGRSTLELNCSANIINECVKKIDSIEMEDDLFKQLEKVVDGNLSDTISRFEFSNMYLSRLKQLGKQERDLGLQ
jgi:hypothetical protein